MKNNKKGFTLIELLAVIAILAILVVIAVPAVLDLFGSSKISAFRTQAQSLLKAADQQIVSDTINPSNGAVTYYSNISGDSTLSLSGGNAVKYYMKVDANTSTPKVVCLVIYDDSFKVELKDPNVSVANISSISDDDLKNNGTYRIKATSPAVATTIADITTGSGFCAP